MRNIATLVVLSLTASLPIATETAHATTDTSPSSYVLDVLDESKIVDKEISELEGQADFEAEDTPPSNAPQARSLTPDETTQQGQNSEAELESFDDENSSAEGDAEDTADPDAVEVPQSRQEDQVPDSEQTPDEQEASEPEADEYTLLTEPLETEGFHVAGVTWDGTAPEQVDVRAYSNGEWTEWFNLEVDVTDEGNPGTDPIMAAGSQGIQVRASGEALPDSLDVHLMTGEGNNGTEVESEPELAEDQPDPSTELESAENVSVTSARGDQNFLLSNYDSGKPAEMQLASTHKAASLKSLPFSQDIVPRTQWGAPREATWRTRYVPLQGAIVHHTAGTNSYTQSQAPGIVRGIWNYHTYTRGWGDIGYNFLIDKFGTVYEGRSGSVASDPGEMAVGAHAAPANTGSVGVSVLGSYTGSTTPSNNVLDTISEVIAWQFAMADVDPTGTFTYGNNVTTNAISGHRDISATVCPGNIYPQLGTIRSSVSSKMDDYTRSQTPTFDRAESSGSKWPQDNAWSVGDITGNNTTDLLLRDSEGYIHVYEGRGDNSFSSPVQIGRGWNIFPDLYTGVDFDGDSVPDILGIDEQDQLFLYSGDGNGGVHEGDQIGRGWNFEHHMVLQQGPGGNAAIVGITRSGILRVYETDGQGNFADSYIISGDFSHLIGAVLVDDWDGSGHSDLVYVNDAGYLRFMSDPIENGFSDSVQIGRKWDGLKIMPSDSSGREHDLLVIFPDGKLMTYVFST